MAAANKDTVLLFGAGSGQLSYLRHFRERGYRVVAVDRDTGALGATEADLLLAVSTHDDRGIRERINEADLKNRITAVACPSTGWAYVSAARVAAWLGVSFSSEEGVLNILDKFRLWQVLNAASLTHRKAYHHRAENSLGSVIHFPLVVKPNVAGGGHRGVSLAQGHSDLPTLVKNAAAASLDGSVLLEEHCLGHEVKLTGFLQNRRVSFLRLAERTFGPGLPGVPVGLAFGAGGKKVEDNLIAFIEKACVVLGLTTTSFNADVILTPGGPELIDFDLALGNLQVLWEEAEDFSALGAIADLALGRLVQPPCNGGESVALTNLWARLPQAAHAHQFYQLCTQEAKNGQRFISAPTWEPHSICPAGLQRLGALLSRADSQQEALREGDRWLERIQKRSAGMFVPEIQVLRPIRPFEYTAQAGSSQREAVYGNIL